MNKTATSLTTPIYHKIDETAEPPGDHPVCHVLAGNGLFTRRKHRFFTSCVRTRNWPSELAPQKQFLRLHCPKLPRVAMERIVGFFSRIADLHGSEAAAILFWDRRTERVRFEIPDQRATVTEGWNGGRYPSDVRYETPHVDPNLSLFGSVHSHVDGPAYASGIDRDDESYLTGLHVVVGRIQDEPPEVHCEYVVDGVRFRVDARAVIEGYERRSADIPDEWIGRVKVDLQRYESQSIYYGGSYDRGPARGRKTY
jgi:hypothetical protein